MAFDPATAALDIGSKLIDRLWPSKAEADAAKMKLFELQQSGELAQMTAQTNINLAEAQSGNPFAATWRPAIGWILALALAYQYLGRPLLIFAVIQFGGTPPTLIGLDDNLWELLFGMLGMGGLRTYEKSKGVAS